MPPPAGRLRQPPGPQLKERERQTEREGGSWRGREKEREREKRVCQWMSVGVYISVCENTRDQAARFISLHKHRNRHKTSSSHLPTNHTTRTCASTQRAVARPTQPPPLTRPSPIILSVGQAQTCPCPACTQFVGQAQTVAQSCPCSVLALSVGQAQTSSLLRLSLPLSRLHRKPPLTDNPWHTHKLTNCLESQQH